MDKIIELKKTLELLKSEKLKNEKILKKLNRETNDIRDLEKSIDTKIDELNNLKRKLEYVIKNKSKIKKDGIINSLLILGIFNILLLLILIVVIELKIPVAQFLSLASFMEIPCTIGSFMIGISINDPSYFTSVKLLKNYNLENIENEILEKEKQRMANKEKLKTNKQKIEDISSKQNSIDLQIKDTLIEISKNQTVQDKAINYILNNSGIIEEVIKDIDNKNKKNNTGSQKVKKLDISTSCSE